MLCSKFEEKLRHMRISIDCVCPLYKADVYIDSLIDGIGSQQDIQLNKVVFVITDTGDTNNVINKILAAGYTYFIVPQDKFSHSLTRAKAIKDYCSSDVVIMLSQDVKLINNKAFFELAHMITDEVVYAYGRQICQKKTIEHYVRLRNYGDKSYIVGSEDVKSLQLRAFFASDAFSAYHRPTFIKLNGYDDKHMMMSEDMYYAKKIIDAGYRKAYVATAVVEHSHKLNLKQLYNRYYATGVWFSEHPEFNKYKTTDTGIQLALYVLVQAIKSFNVPVLLQWLPNMSARYFGMKKGKNKKR